MKFEELMNIINSEVSNIMKKPLKEPSLPKKVKKPYQTALQSESEIDEVLFIQDDIIKLEKEEQKNKQKKL